MTAVRRTVALPFALLTLVALAAAAPAAEGEAADPAEPGPPPIHEDADGLLEAMVDSFRAALRDDVEALAESLERVENGTIPLERGTAGRYEPLVAMSRGYRVALDVSAQAARDGDLSTSRKQFYFVYMGCRECHVLARQNGLLANTPLRDGE